MSLPVFSVSVVPKVSCVNFFVLVFCLSRFILGRGRVYLVFRFYSSRFIFLRHSLPFYSFYFLSFLLSCRVYLGCGLKRSPVLSGDLVFHCLRFFLGGGWENSLLFSRWGLRKLCAFSRWGLFFQPWEGRCARSKNRWEKVVIPTRLLCWIYALTRKKPILYMPVFGYVCAHICITADSTFSLFFVSVVAMVAGRRY